LALPNAALSVHCRIRDGRIEAVAIGPRFLPPLAALLRGKTPAEALARVSALFALCRHGQCLAFTKAIGQALAVPAAPDWNRVLRILRDLEMLREHSLNLVRLPGWPAPEPGLPARLLAAVAGIAGAVGGRGAEVFLPDGGLLAPDGEALEHHGQALWATLDGLLGAGWLAAEPDFQLALSRPDWPLGHFLGSLGSAADTGRGAVPAPLPRRLPETALSAALTGPAANGFSARPRWEGRPRETGCYARRHGLAALRTVQRHHGAGLTSRIFARLLEMRCLAHGLRRRLAWLATRPAIPKPLPARATGGGIGQVQTARGLLIHGVKLENGLVADVRYVAPTEWNFHPEGLLAKALEGLPAADETELRRRVGLFLHAIDPCVDFRLELQWCDHEK
jgi:hypothetical protein